MKRLLIIAAALAAVSVPNGVWAQSGPATPEKTALAKEVFQTANLPQMMDGVMSMTSGVTQSMLSKLPAAEQQKAAAFQRASNEEMKEHFIPKLVDQMSSLYAQTFTVDELQGILAFYKGPTGQAFLHKTPAMMKAFTPQVLADVSELLRGTVTRYCAENTCTDEEHSKFDKMLAGRQAGQ